MDVLEAIHGLRVVRRFADRPLEPDQLTTILGAGRRASSSRNQQRWDFIVVTERDRLRELTRLGPSAGHVGGAAATVALVTPDPHRADVPLSILWDLGLAAQNMILAAWALGIGSCPATVYDQDLARRLLGYPAGHTCQFLLSFGHPADPTDLSRPLRPGGRRPLAEIVHEDRW
jgi:nitroreductase